MKPIADGAGVGGSGALSAPVCRGVEHDADQVVDGDVLLLAGRAKGEFDASLKTILNQNRMLEDNFPALVGSDFIWRLHGGELDLAGLRKRLEKVSRDDIAAAAATIRHDTTYFLHS